MATLHASTIVCSSNSLSNSSRRGVIRGAISIPRLPKNPLSLPTLSTRGLVDELELRNDYTIKTSPTQIEIRTKSRDSLDMAKLYAIMEAVADRIEMHENIGEQRNNWNSLLLNSINMMTLSAATMTGIASTLGTSLSGPLAALKVSSTFMYLAATGLLYIMNKIQPSQLVEEQRNASRLFKQLHTQIQTTIALGGVTNGDVKEAMEKVLALDRAFPLPLLGAMLEKFPKAVESAVWWPQQKRRVEKIGGKIDRNGWDLMLEEEMRDIVGVLERKDKEEYLRLGEKAVRLNKILAISGPILTGLAALGSAFVGSPSQGSWAALLGVVGGAVASVLNTIEHCGQVGMVFEMYRSNAGFFGLMGETIESNLQERDVERRENGELLEMKVALQLGRSLSELRSLSTSSRKGQESEEFASKLF